ncbi:MAG: hypothetical protein WCJ66_13330 [Verrucomicrobiota bacterium]
MNTNSATILYGIHNISSASRFKEHWEVEEDLLCISTLLQRVIRLLLILGALLSFSQALRANGLELRYYTADEDGCREVFKIISRADRKLECDGGMKFTIGIGRVIGNSSQLIKFDFDEIMPFLIKEKHKDMLVVWLGLGIMANDDTTVRESVRKLSEMMNSLGYKRVIIIGAGGGGVHYLADTAIGQTKTNKNKAKSKK